MLTNILNSIGLASKPAKPMSETKIITPYEKVASLLCLDIDVIGDTIDANPNISTDDMRLMLKNLRNEKNRLVRDPEGREVRYNAMSTLLYASKNTPV